MKCMSCKMHDKMVDLPWIYLYVSMSMSIDRPSKHDRL
jgi:hypothetical protein